MIVVIMKTLLVFNQINQDQAVESPVPITVIMHDKFMYNHEMTNYCNNNATKITTINNENNVNNKSNVKNVAIAN